MMRNHWLIKMDFESSLLREVPYFTACPLPLRHLPGIHRTGSARGAVYGHSHGLQWVKSMGQKMQNQGQWQGCDSQGSFASYASVN